MKFIKKSIWARHGLLNVLEHASIRILDAGITFSLIKSMSAHQFGLFSVYQSWVSFMLLFLPALETAFYKNYAQYKMENRLSKERSIYRFYLWFKIIFALFAVFSLSWISQDLDWPTRFLLLLFAAALPLSHAAYGFFMEPLRFELHQKTIVVVSGLQRAVLLGILLVIQYGAPQNIVLLTSLAMGSYVLFGFAWALVFKKFRLAGMYAPCMEKLSFFGSFRAVGSRLWNTVLWIHLIGISLQTVQTLDIFWLNARNENLNEIGLYSIALKSANFFQFLPLALMNTFAIYLSRREGSATQDKKLTSSYVFIFLICSGALFLFGSWIGEPLLGFLAKGKLNGDSLQRTEFYFKWQLAGVLILCASYPLSTYLNARESLRRLLTFVYLPWFALSCLLYAFATQISISAAAQANVAVYSTLWILLFAYYLASSRK